MVDSNYFPLFFKKHSADTDVLTLIRETRFIKYFLALFSVALFASIQGVLWNYLDPFAFSLFFPSIILSALFGGFAPAVMATFFSVVVVNIFFLERSFIDGLHRSDIIRIITFSSNGILVAWVTHYFFDKYRELAKASLEETLLRMGDGFIILSPSLQYLYVNERAANYMGISRETLLGKKLTEIYPYVIGSDLEKNLRHVFEHRAPLNYEYFSSPTGRWFDMQMYPSTQGIKIYYREITDRKLTEKQLSMRAEEALAANAKLQRLNRELQRSNDELAQFAHVASHDMKEPLRTISTYVQLLQETYADRLDAEGKQYMKFVVDGSKRMLALIHDVLSYSKVSNDLRTTENVPLEKCIKDTLKNLQYQIEEGKAKVNISSIPPILVPERLFTQVLQNLISNALKFHRPTEAALVTLCFEQQPDEWLIQIKDNGIGIDPAQQESIFDLFKRLNPHSIYPGSGIGLALCKRIVEFWGGRIWVEPSKEGGSVFAFTIPKILR